MDGQTDGQTELLLELLSGAKNDNDMWENLSKRKINIRSNSHQYCIHCLVNVFD